MLGPYQANGAFALRSWVESHGCLLDAPSGVHRIAGWVRRPENRANAWRSRGQAEDSPRRRRAHLPRARRSGRGFTPDARFEWEGFRNLLALRAEIEQGKGGEEPESYLDLSYYRARSRRWKNS